LRATGGSGSESGTSPGKEQAAYLQAIIEITTTITSTSEL